MDLRKLVVILATFVLLVTAACGTSGPDSSSSTSVPATTTSQPVVIVAPVVCGPLPPGRVPPEEVMIIGTLTSEEAVLVDWAMARFSEAGLGLPPEIEVVFDPTREACRGDLGRCLMPNGMPRAYVCRPVEQLRNTRIETTMLHELAHVWNWTYGPGDEWPDDSSIVGGNANDPDAIWSDRTEERVAMIVAWGLLEAADRQEPLPHDCDETWRQFVALTGAEPLGRLPAGCGE